MTYSIIDVLKRLYKIEIHMSEAYDYMSKTHEKNSKSFSIITKVISKEEKKHAEAIAKLESEIKRTYKEGDIEIDFFIYDKVSELMYEFEHKHNIPTTNNSKQFINFIYKFEKDNLALLIDIRGRFVQKNFDIHKKTYKVLSELIEQEEKHIKDLQPYAILNQ